MRLNKRSLDGCSMALENICCLGARPRVWCGTCASRLSLDFRESPGN